MPQPPVAGPEIRREHLIRTLETLLEGETQAVVIEGPDGIGKSTLLRQFIEANPGRTFGVFLSSASRWMYDPSAVTARLASEMSETVRGRPLEDDDVDL